MSQGVRQIRLGRKMRGPADGSSYSLPRLNPAEEAELVTIPADSLSRHVCIFGRTGAGKSITGMVIASELARLGGISIVILDRTGEFSRSGLATLPNATVHVPGVNLAISPFARRSEDQEDDEEHSISLMHHFVESTFPGLNLSPFQERALRDALNHCYSRGRSRLSDVISQLEAQGEKSRDKVKGWLEGNQAVISKLIPLARGSLAKAFDLESSEMSADLLFRQGLHIINLGTFDTDEARNMLSQVLCKMAIDHGKKLGETKTLRLVLMVDEAQHIAPSRKDYDGILEKYAIELRKYGMGLMVIATRPTQVSENIIANCNTIICHSFTSSKDTDLVLNYMVSRLEVDRFISAIRTLDVGECLVQCHDARTVPLTCKVGLPEQLSLLSRDSMPTGLRSSPENGGSGATDDIVVPSNDSAWTINGKLPPWAIEVAMIVERAGGRLSWEVVQRRINSNRKVKQMVHGRYPLLEFEGGDLVLTKLGEKIAAISKSARPTPVTDGEPRVPSP